MPDDRKVMTAAGDIEYNFLIISTGIRIADEDVLNLIEQPASNAHAWELGETVEMRKRVEAFRGWQGCPDSPHRAF